MDVQSIINSINWTSPNWDLFIIIIFVVGIFLYSLSLNRDRVFVVLVASYMSLAIASKAPLLIQTFGMNLENSFSANAMMFGGGILLLFFIISGSIFTSVFDQSLNGSWFQAVAIGFLQIGLSISVIVSFLPPEGIDNLSIFIKSCFADSSAQAFWLLSPFIAMILFRGKH